MSSAGSSDMAHKGVFTQGSTLRHIIVMTLTGAVGLLAIMLVDFVDLLYIKSLGTTETAAAIGFSGNVLFYLTSINIGISIAAGVLIAKAMGRNAIDEAKQLSTDFYLLSSVGMGFVAVALWFLTPAILSALGAEGRTLELATSYLRIMWWSAPIFVLGFCGMAILRSSGDAKGSMTCTLVAALVNAVLDPFLIFDQPLTLLGIDAHIGAGMGIEGAAVSSVVARIVMAVVALQATIGKHKMISPLRLSKTVKNLPMIGAIAIPAILTNFATPVGDSFVTRAIAGFGDAAVSAYAVIGRLIPIAFAVTFALSGAVGPIIAQNMTAKLYSRVNQTLKQAIGFVALYVGLVCFILLLLEPKILLLFSAVGEEAELIVFFLNFISFGFIFMASMFVANASFNNMGKPTWATILNFSRALGAVPFLFVGAHFMGAKGVFLGQMIWTICVAVVGIYLSFNLLGKIAMGDETFTGVRKRHTFWRVPVYSFGNFRVMPVNEIDVSKE